MNRRRIVFATALAAPFGCSAGGSRTLASFGARGNGEADDTAALNRALTDYSGDVSIAAGTYRYTHTLKLIGSGRTVRFEPGAMLLGDDASATGIEIRNASQVTLSGATLTWRSPAPRRISFGAGVLVMGGADVRIERAVVDGFGGAGLLFESCLRPVVAGARVRKTLADGVHFANCAQPLAEDIDCQDTGDDGLAFVNYRRLPDATGGTARRIVVTDSGARGITVVGQSEVTVSGFKVLRTRASGIYVAQEESYGTRVPRKVVFENGSVDGAGTQNGPGGGNRCGAELVRSVDTTLSSITITNTRSRMVGVNGASGTVRLANLTLHDNEGGEGIYLLASEHVQIIGGRVVNAFNTGLYAKDVQTLAVSELQLSGCAERGASRTAVWLEGVGDLQARFGAVEASAASASPARVMLRRIASGAASLPDEARAGRRVSVSREDSPALRTETR